MLDTDTIGEKDYNKLCDIIKERNDEWKKLFQKADEECPM